MDRINQFSFYEVGKKLGRLYVTQGTQADVEAQKVFGTMYEARSAIAALLKGDPFQLSISKQCAIQLRDALDNIWTQHFSVQVGDGTWKFKYPEDNEKIPSWIWSGMTTALEHFETVFAEEMREAATYYVLRRGIFFTPALVDAAEETFPASIVPFIPEKTKLDWQAAGRCLAFNILTASGFHAARAVEGTLEAYYQLFSGQPGKILRSWDDYIKALTKVAENGGVPAPTAKTLSELDQMRTYDRNPIMHPRVVLGESDARILFGSSESLIIAMAQEIKSARENGGVQSDLELVDENDSSAA